MSELEPVQEPGAELEPGAEEGAAASAAVAAAGTAEQEPPPPQAEGPPWTTTVDLECNKKKNIWMELLIYVN